VYKISTERAPHPDNSALGRIKGCVEVGREADNDDGGLRAIQRRIVHAVSVLEHRASGGGVAVAVRITRDAGTRVETCTGRERGTARDSRGTLCIHTLMIGACAQSVQARFPNDEAKSKTTCLPPKATCTADC
jgi:hypothetical protein